MKDVSTTMKDKIESAERAENKITNIEADKNSKMRFLGVPSKAVIIDVQTEGLEDNIVIRFKVNLPTEETGYIDFTKYMVENEELDIFLDNIGCTRSNLTDGFYADVPVTYTDFHGWKVFYSKSEYELKTYLGNSNLRVLGSDMGYTYPNNKLRLFYHSMFVLSFMAILYLSGINEGSIILSSMIGLFVWAFIWYLDSAWSGMNHPRNAKVKI